MKRVKTESAKDVDELDLIEIANSIDELDHQIKMLQKKKRKLRRKTSDAERGAREHALIVLGGIVASAFGGGQDAWRRIDYAAFTAYAQQYSRAIGNCAAREVDATAAAKRLRRWERTGEWSDDPDIEDAPAREDAQADDDGTGPC